MRPRFSFSLRTSSSPKMAGLAVAALLFSALPLLLPAGPALAATRVVPLATRLTLEVPTASALGSDITTVSILKDTAGRPIADIRVAVSVDNLELRSDRTLPTGKVTLVVRSREVSKAGSYTIKVAFAGNKFYLPATAVATVKVLPAAVQVHTVPPLPGIPMTLGGLTAVTGPDGTAAFPVPEPGSYTLSADLNPENPVDPLIRASFVRWLDDVYTPARTLFVAGPASYTMGLRVAYRASVQFVDLDNQPVDPNLVSEARFSAGTGTDDVVLNSQLGADQVWWTAGNAIRRGLGLQVSPVEYRLLSVKIAGAEVVNRGQQAWTPTEGGVWTIQLLLYGMTVQTEDALFGTPVSGSLQLVYPNGQTTTAPVGRDGTVSFKNLPRGQYQLKLQAAAITPPTPVALSKPQTATLKVVTYLDIGLGVGVLLLAVLLLVVVGRRSSRVSRSVRWVLRRPQVAVGSGRSAMSSLARRLRKGRNAADLPPA